MDEPIAILGAGSWGTALALYLSRQHQNVRLWSIETDHIEEMIKEKVNRRFLPDFPFPKTLVPMTNLAEAINGVSDVMIVIPSAGFRDTLEMLKPLITPKMRIAWGTKGIDLETGQLLHEVAKEILGKERAYGVLSGPSFAREVAAG